MKKSFAWTFIIVLTGFSTVRAQTSDPIYSLPDIVAMALKENPLLTSQQARAEETRLAGSQFRVWPGPSVDVAAGRRTDSSDSGPRLETAVSQPLPLLGKQYLRGQLSDLESESWNVQRTASQSSITLDVVRLSVEYVNNRRWADFVEKRQKHFALIRSYLGGRVFASPQKKAESRIVQNRLKVLFSEASQAQADFRAALADLTVYAPLGPSVLPEIKVPWFSGTQSFNADDLMEEALKSNPELRLKDIGVRAAKTDKSLAAKDQWPETKLIASYEQTKASGRETNTGLGVGFDFSSWNGNRLGLKSAEQRIIAEESTRALEERQLKAEMNRALLQYEAARNVVKEYPASLLDEIDAQLQESEEGFRKGQVDLLTFLELDDSSAEMLHRVLNAQIDLITKATDLLRLTGEKSVLTRLESL